MQLLITKTNDFILYCLRFALSFDKIGFISTIKIKIFYFILYCLRFALSLQKINCTRQFESKLSLPSFVLSLQQIKTILQYI